MLAAFTSRLHGSMYKNTLHAKDGLKKGVVLRQSALSYSAETARQRLKIENVIMVLDSVQNHYD